MQQELRESDLLARWGGEEFLALLPAADPQAALQVAERVRQAVAAVPIEVDGRPLAVTLSIGVAGVDTADGLHGATLRADRALYASKHGGRNRVTLADQHPAAAAGAALQPA